MSFLIAETSSASIVMWSIVLIGVLVGGLVAVLRVKKWMSEDEDTSGGGGFSLSDLRRMHKAGKMTDDEYEKAKIMIVGTAKTTMPDAPARDRRDSSPPPRRNDQTFGQ